MTKAQTANLRTMENVVERTMRANGYTGTLTVSNVRTRKGGMSATVKAVALADLKAGGCALATRTYRAVLTAKGVTITAKGEPVLA